MTRSLIPGAVAVALLLTYASVLGGMVEQWRTDAVDVWQISGEVPHSEGIAAQLHADFPGKNVFSP